MILIGRIVKGTKTIRQSTFKEDDEGADFADLLEKGLIALCRELEIPVPLWLKKNTTEFARYRRTFFTSDQFVETVNFDKFEFKLG
ncbi:MAG: hypothetical protein GX383_12940 [Clostridium sp.]|nr:hypothetical protein [Clostridium sp.]